MVTCMRYVEVYVSKVPFTEKMTAEGVDPKVRAAVLRLSKTGTDVFTYIAESEKIGDVVICPFGHEKRLGVVLADMPVEELKPDILYKPVSSGV